MEERDLAKPACNLLNLDDADSYIYMKGGTIVYDSVFEKQFTGDLKHLLNCVEESIFDDKIDWNMVKRYYEG